ncbi:MAG TPA: hypothetical protein VHF06_23290 [Pseudonocardiaceae bacterium]|nr:hypothetical protein [Pseudonocardiaceae bacterium]
MNAQQDDGRDDDPIADELIGLDPDDPETRAFADHLRRMQAPANSFTVEGYVRGVGEFANSANRANGHRRLMAVIVVGLILLGVLWAVWQTLGTVLSTFVGS